MKKDSYGMTASFYSITLEKLSQPRSLPCRRPGIFFTTNATKRTKKKVDFCVLSLACGRAGFVAFVPFVPFVVEFGCG